MRVVQLGDGVLVQASHGVGGGLQNKHPLRVGEDGQLGLLHAVRLSETISGTEGEHVVNFARQVYLPLFQRSP